MSNGGLRVVPAGDASPTPRAALSGSGTEGTTTASSVLPSRRDGLIASSGSSDSQLGTGGRGGHCHVASGILMHLWKGFRAP